MFCLLSLQKKGCQDNAHCLFYSNCYSKCSYHVAFLLQILRSELKEREYLVISTLDQARMFLADQPIEGPGEPRKNLQPKTGMFKKKKSKHAMDTLFFLVKKGVSGARYITIACSVSQAQ